MSSAALGRTRAAPHALVRAVPAWAWLAGLVVLSTVVRYGFGRRIVAPWIMVDELIYSELARSVAEDGRFAIRDVVAGGSYGVVYPLLISPAYALFDAIPDAYAAAKAINGLLMSLAAVPAYLLARTVLRPPLALAAAVLAVAVPGTHYAGMLMTENAFYVLFLLAALALVRALERPTFLRTLAFLLAAALAFATRAQAVVLVPALLTAPLVLAVMRREGLRRYRSLYVAAAAAGVAVLAVEALRGRSPWGLLGAYRSAGERDYDAATVARWLLYHVAELDLALGVLPFAALLLLAAVARRLEPGAQALVAATVALSAWLLPVVAAFATTHTFPVRVEERNAFYLMPLYLIALLVWVDGGLPRPRAPAAVAALTAALLPALLPYASLIDVPAQSDTWALLPLWEVHEAFVPLDRMWVFVGLAGLALAAAFLLVPRRLGLVLPGLVLAYFAASTYPVEAGAHGIRRASIGALFQGITVPERDWIDRALGRDARVAAVWAGRGDRLVVNQNEFFSRSVRAVYHLRGPTPGGLPETPLETDTATGIFHAPDGREVRVPYAFADRELELAGAIVAQDVRKGTAVVRVDNPLRTTRRIRGLYDDAWSAPVLRYTRYRCRGGSLTVQLDGDPRLIRRAQTVRALVAAREVARARVPVGVRGTLLTVPLRRGPDRNCHVRFLVDPTAVPGGDDTRRLGTHFRSFRYRP